MSSHNSVAKSVREHKELHPELYCPKCLWRTGDGSYCPRHHPHRLVEFPTNRVIDGTSATCDDCGSTMSGQCDRHRGFPKGD